MSYAIADEPHDHPRLTPAVQGLLAVNVVIYFLQVTLPVSGSDMQEWLGFQMRDLPGAWWKAITYMFVHGGFWHLAGNMYMLWLFGPRVEHEWSAKSFLRFYLLCGLGGWFAHIISSPDGLLMGSSAAVFGVMFAYAREWGDDEIHLFGVVPIRVRWLVTGYIAYDLVMGLMQLHAARSGTAHLAHVGGVATAWFLLRTSSGSGLDRLRQRVHQIPDVPDETPRAVPPRPSASPRPRERGSDADEAVARSKALVVRPQQPPRAPAPPRVPIVPITAANAGSELDRLLDKISAGGMGSLTSEERVRLEEASRKLKEG